MLDVITTWQYSSQSDVSQNASPISSKLPMIIKECDMIDILSDENKFNNFVHNMRTRNQNVDSIITTEHTTFLQKAAELNKFRWVQKLLNLGANVNAKDYNNWTALHFAVATGMKGSLGMVNMLVQAKADWTIKEDDDGLNPVDLALRVKSIDLSIKGYMLSLVGPEFKSSIVRDVDFSKQFRPIEQKELSFINMRSVRPLAIRQSTPQDQLTSKMQELKDGSTQKQAFIGSSIWKPRK